jgi:hypothetical protein
LKYRPGMAAPTKLSSTHVYKRYLAPDDGHIMDLNVESQIGPEHIRQDASGPYAELTQHLRRRVPLYG